MKIFLCRLLVFLLSTGTLFAWTEKEDRIKREQKARSIAQARIAIAQKLALDTKRAEAQRLASLGNLTDRNYKSYFDIEWDDFEKFEQFSPKALSKEMLSLFPPSEKYLPKLGFFAPFIRVFENAITCTAKIISLPETPRFVESVVFLFDSGETVKLTSPQLQNEAPLAKYSTIPLHLNVTGTQKTSGDGSRIFRAHTFSGDAVHEFRFESNGTQNYTVTGNLPETQVSWTQVLYAEISDELLEKISKSNRVRIRFYYRGNFQKSDRELSTVEHLAFRTLHKMKTILASKQKVPAATP